ncbi:MAG: alpha/beta hydrolase family protein [Pirellulales bacterium]
MAVLGVTIGLSPLATAGEVAILTTPAGLRFGLEGAKPDKPAPTLLVLGSSIEATLGNDVYNKIGRLAAEQGWISVGIDLPCHGQEHHEGTPEGLSGWAARLQQGQDFMAEHVARCKALVDYLIEQGYADPERIAVAGTSRGGFSALHYAAADPRVRCTVAFAPVADLTILREFAGLDEHELTRSLDLSRQSAALAERPLWICIGNNDERVGTDSIISFSREVTAAAVRLQIPPDTELHVMTSRGHTIHPTAHDEAAAWLLRQVP